MSDKEKNGLPNIKKRICPCLTHKRWEDCNQPRLYQSVKGFDGPSHTQGGQIKGYGEAYKGSWGSTDYDCIKKCDFITEIDSVVGLDGEQLLPRDWLCDVKDIWKRFMCNPL